MKNGTTHLAYKPEHAVDLDTGVVATASIVPVEDGEALAGPGSGGAPPRRGRAGTDGGGALRRGRRQGLSCAQTVEGARRGRENIHKRYLIHVAYVHRLAEIALDVAEGADPGEHAVGLIAVAPHRDFRVGHEVAVAVDDRFRLEAAADQQAFEQIVEAEAPADGDLAGEVRPLAQDRANRFVLFVLDEEERLLVEAAPAEPP
jgi:hypothetical protein